MNNQVKIIIHIYDEYDGPTAEQEDAAFWDGISRNNEATWEREYQQLIYNYYEDIDYFS
jgi:hypothetical protein